jgi:hypothetical protein
MEGQRCRRYFKRLADAASRDTIRPCLNQQAEDRESGFLSECRKSRYSRLYFHISSIIEISVLSTPVTPMLHGLTKRL